jgi:hypothetical protein
MTLAARKPSKPRRDWYSISVDTIRGVAFGLLGFMVLAAGYVGWRIWERRDLEREVRNLIADDQALLLRLPRKEQIGSYTGEFEVGFQSFQQANQQLEHSDFPGALVSARRSRTVLQAIADALNRPGSAGAAQFISLQGEVEYRRGESGSWEEARVRVPLRLGDYVRTFDGAAAEIVFSDGTLYSVRSNTQFIVSRVGTESGGGGEQSIQMEFGWVDLNTASRPSQVKTPGAVANVKHDSEAFVAFDKNANRGRFGAFKGEIDLATQGGQTRHVKELEQVVQTGGLLSEPERLPGSPEPLGPGDNTEINLGQADSLVLSWSAVNSAARYALQIARSRQFVDNVISVENRQKTHATLGLRGEGTFYWRVAALDRAGTQGPWSKPLRFRVASFKEGAGERSRTPPELELEDVKSYGSIFIVAGRSDPGSQIEINGEQVSVGVDGSFTKTVQLTKEGWSFIEIRASDRWGNETLRRRRVFVEGP